ncbi:NADase-type glycan-binding domain-containing protein [Streptomyces sp. NPDC051555]|uniref:NADase-type glycan-binding domain-containing protein n=1 Tax=Streptomyces sp. NPDC051555 TaxID=3365657 RepID=UPI00378818D6
METEQDVCPGCGVVAYPGEMFCVSCGAYMGWDVTGSNRVVDPGPAAPAPEPLTGNAPGTGTGRGSHRGPHTETGPKVGPVPTRSGSHHAAGAGAGSGQHLAGAAGYPAAAAPTSVPAPIPASVPIPVPSSLHTPSDGSAYGTGPQAPYQAAPTGQDGWPQGLRDNRTGRATELTGELFRPDPLFAQAPTAPAPSTARPQPARPQAARSPADFTAAAASGAAPVGYAAAPVGYPAAPVGYVTPAAESAAERTQVISGQVVLRTALADPPPATTATGHPTATGYPGGRGEEATPAAGIPHLLLCPECRQPNAENRTYCHPCGAQLRPEPEPPEPTRWQQIKQDYLERPDVWHWDRRWGVVAVALPVCMAAGMSMGSAAAAAQSAVPLIKDRFLSQYQVPPDKVSASSNAKGFEANLAADGMDNKAWAPKGTGEKAVGQYWTADFNAPFRLTSLLIVNGASKSPGQFWQTGRPTKITVTATTTDRGLVEKEITLGGQPGSQRFDLGIDNVVSVQVKIEAVNPGLKPNMPVAMAEIQFFSRQAT